MSSSECFKCHKIGHFARECPEGGDFGDRRNGYNRSYNSDREFSRGGRGGGGGGRGGGGGGGGRGGCFNCGKSGHMARDCDQGGRTCYQCGKTGHISRDCDNRDRD